MTTAKTALAVMIGVPAGLILFAWVCAWCLLSGSRDTVSAYRQLLIDTEKLIAVERKNQNKREKLIPLVNDPERRRGLEYEFTSAERRIEDLEAKADELREKR